MPGSEDADLVATFPLGAELILRLVDADEDARFPELLLLLLRPEGRLTLCEGVGLPISDFKRQANSTRETEGVLLSLQIQCRLALTRFDAVGSGVSGSVLITRRVSVAS